MGVAPRMGIKLRPCRRLRIHNERTRAECSNLRSLGQERVMVDIRPMIDTQKFTCKLCYGGRTRRIYRLGLKSSQPFAAGECADCGLFQVIYPWWQAPALEMTSDYDDPGLIWTSPEELAANRAKAEYFARLLNGEVGIAGKKILDLGCGKGFFLRACLDLGAADVVGQEFRHEDVVHARDVERLADIRVAEIGRTDVWPDAEFDVSCSFDVIEHVHDLGNFVANAVRVTRTGGFLFQATPGYDALSHRVGRMLLRIGVTRPGTVLVNVQPASDFSGGPHVSIIGNEQIRWVAGRFGLSSTAVRYVGSYSYSDRHYAKVVPLLNYLPSALGTLIFRLVRKTIRNKLVWFSRVAQDRAG
jgi:SAM-dependent methyltransferase